MNIDFFGFDGVHLLGDSATHPMEPLATRLGSLLLLAGRSCSWSSRLRGAAMPEAWPAQAVQTCAGTFGAAALALPRRAASGPLGRVLLRNLVSNKSSLCESCEEFKYSKSFVARARLLQIQIGTDCLFRSRALAPNAVQFRLVRLSLQQVKSLRIMRRIQMFQVMRREGATPTHSNRHRLSV